MIRRAAGPLRTALLGELRCLAGSESSGCGRGLSTSACFDEESIDQAWTSARPDISGVSAWNSVWGRRWVPTATANMTAPIQRALQMPVAQLPRARGYCTKDSLSADHVEFLLEAIVRPSHDQLKALRALFSDFDGEKIIQTGGVLNTLEPHVQRVLVDLAAAFREDAKNFTLKQCANILSTMVLLGHFDTGLKDAIVDRVLLDIKAKTVDPEILGAICYCIGVGGYSDHAFFKALEKFVVENTDAFSTRALSKTLWMFSRVDYNSDEIDDTRGKMVDRVLKENDTVTEDLAYGIWACADHEVYADRLTARIMKGPFDQLSTFSATAIAKLAFGISQQQADDDEAYSAITKRATEIADEFFPRDIAKLLWALGNINFADPELLKALEPCIIRHLNKFNHNELDMIVMAYNNFGLHNATVVQVADHMVCIPR